MILFLLFLNLLSLILLQANAIRSYQVRSPKIIYVGFSLPQIAMYVVKDVEGQTGYMALGLLGKTQK